ncbi:MAG: CPBP family intramembrane metalloprotease [Oscillospiraceae bacterium]
MKSKRLSYIIASSLIIILSLYFVDQVLQVNYISKVLVKVFVFLIAPLIYIGLSKYNFIKDALKVIKKPFRFKLSHLLGLLVAVILFAAFLVVQRFMNVDVLISELEEKYRISKNNIFFYGAYLVFVNSLIEEFFFRGFLFLNIKELHMKRTAYIVSAAAFSVYHISNFQNWFNVWVLMLALVGLFLSGLLFSFLNDKDDTFLNSWFVHICADVSIVVIGYILLNRA